MPVAAKPVALERRHDTGKHAGQLGHEAAYGYQETRRDKACNKCVFNSGDAAFVFDEAFDKIRHDAFPRIFLMAMWQMIRHFFGVAANGFSLPRRRGAACLDARHGARFSLAVSLRF